MLFRCNSDFEGLILQWLISAPRFYFAAESKELFLTLVNDDQAAVSTGYDGLLCQWECQNSLHFTHGSRSL
jgi:hypothetical protein